MYAINRTLCWSKLMFVLILLLTNGIPAKQAPTTKTAKTKKDSTLTTTTPLATLAAPLFAPVNKPDIPDVEFKTTATVTSGKIAPGITATNFMTTTAPPESRITHKPSAKKAEKTKKAKKEKKKDLTFTTIPVEQLDVPDEADGVFKIETVTTGAIAPGNTATHFETTTVPPEGKVTHKPAANKSKKALDNIASIDLETTSDKVAPEISVVNLKTTVKFKTDEITDKTFPPTHLEVPDKPDGEFKTTGSVTAGESAPGITTTHFKKPTAPPDGKINLKLSAKISKKEKKKDSTLTTPQFMLLDKPDIADGELKTTTTFISGEITPEITASRFETSTAAPDSKITHTPAENKSKKTLGKIAEKDFKTSTEIVTLGISAVNMETTIEPKIDEMTIVTTLLAPLDALDNPDGGSKKTGYITTAGIAKGITPSHSKIATTPPESKINHKPTAKIAKKTKKAKSDKKKDSTLTTTPLAPLDEPDIQDVEFITTAPVTTGGNIAGITATHFMTTTVPSEGKINHKPSAKKTKKAKKEKKKDSTLTTTPLSPLDEPDIPDVEFKTTAPVTTGGITSGTTATQFMTTTVPSEGKINHKPSAKKTKKAKKENKKDSISTNLPIGPSDEPDIPDGEFKTTDYVTTGVIAPGITHTHFKTTTDSPEGKITSKPTAEKSKKALGKIAAINFKTSTEIVASGILEVNLETTVEPTIDEITEEFPPLAPSEEHDIPDSEFKTTASVIQNSGTTRLEHDITGRSYNTFKSATEDMVTSEPPKYSGTTRLENAIAGSSFKTPRDATDGESTRISQTTASSTELPDGKVKSTPKTEEMITIERPIMTRAYPVTISRTENYEERIARTDKYEEMIARTEHYEEMILRTENYEEMIARTDKYEEMIARTDKYEEMITRTENYEEMIARTDTYEEMIARTDKYEEMIARTENYEEMIARTEHYEEMIARTDKYEEMIARTENYEEMIARTENYEEMIARTDKYEEMIARTDKYEEMIARTDKYEEMIARTENYEEMITRTENYEEMIAQTDKYEEMISRTDKYEEMIARTENYEEMIARTEHYEEMIARTDKYEEMIARTENYEEMIARTENYEEMIARTDKYEEMIARTDKYEKMIARTDKYEEMIARTENYEEMITRTENYEEMIARTDTYEEMIERTDKYEEMIARTENYEEMIARTDKYEEMIARTDKYEEMIARTDKYEEMIARTENYEEMIARTENYEEMISRTDKYEEMIARTDKYEEMIARTENYEEMIARTENYEEMIAPTDKYEEMIARTENYEEMIARTENYEEMIARTDKYEEMIARTDKYEEMIARTDKYEEMIARTENYEEMIARTENYEEMIARTDTYEEMIAQTEKYFESIAGPDFVTSPYPLLNEAVIAAEFPDGMFEPIVRTEAMIANESPVIAREYLETIARTENYQEMIARTEQYEEMIARTENYEKMIAQTEKYLESIAGPEFVTSPPPVLSKAVIAAEFPVGIFKPEAVIANESPVIARENLETIARTENNLEMIARTKKNLESIAGPDFVTSPSPVLSDAVIAAEFPESILEPSVKTEAMIANQSPVIATNTIPPVLIETVNAPDNPMAMAMNVESPAVSDLSDDASVTIRSNTSAYAITTAVTTSMEPAVGLRHNQLCRLLDSVLIDYDKRLRPRKNQARFVTIFSDFVPQSIIEFNTLLQSFTVMGYFKMDWRDDFLRWNFNDYGDTKYLRIPAKSIWIPKLIVDKSRDGYGLVGDRKTDIALIHYRGYVRWFPEGIYSVVCKVSIRFFPFDVQTCTLSYFIADEDDLTINLKHEDHVDLSEFIENAEWNLINVTSDLTKVDNVHFVNFHFKVERRGGFTMFTLVVPVLLLSMLSGATFLIPIESGEKCGFSVTIFLAYGIFETIVIDTLPHNSLDVSYFIIYLTVMVTVSIMLSFYTILQAKVFDMVGAEEFRLMRCSNHGYGISWGTFLRKLDTYVFVGFLVLVLGSTTTFFTVLVERLHFV